MASLRVLAFDHEGRPVQFDTWLDDLQLYLLSNIKDSVSLFDHVSGANTAAPATADSATCSQWLSRDAAARLAIRNHLPLAECAHFGQHRTAQTLYDTVVARYSSPATAALGRLLLPYLFPELSAFATVKDLVSHLRASVARYRAADPAKFLDRNQPPMFITLYFIVTRLPDSLRSVRDHFLSLDPTSLTIDLLEQHLLAAGTSAVAVGAARGTPRPPFFEGCSHSPLAPSYASTAAADISVAEDIGAASASAKHRSSKGKGGRGGGSGSAGGGGGSGGSGEGSSGGGGGGVGSGGSGAVAAVGLVAVGLALGMLVLEVASFSSSSVGARPSRPRSFVSGFCSVGRLGIVVAAHMSFARGDCYRCVLPDPGIAAAALGASESGTLPGTAPSQALHTFTLDAGASACFFRDRTTLTPLSASVPVRLAHPSGGLVVARSSTVLQCPAVPSGSLSSLHLPSFSTNLVSAAALQDAMVTTTTPGGQCVSICTCTRTGRHLATFTRRPGSSLYTLATKPPQVAASAQVSASGQVAASCSSLPPLPPSPAPPCLPCVEGRQRAAPHSSSFPPTSAPLQTLRMDVWGPARVSGQGRERNFLLVVDDYTRYTTVFPLRSKGEVSDVLIPLIHTVCLQLRERFGQDLLVLRLHSDRGGEFSSNLLRDLCHGEGILQSFTLPDSPQQNGIAERRIGLVMEVARTSMIHVAAPHFLWPFAVRYAAHQLNLWPRVSLPETLPTLVWTGKVGDASVFRVWGSCAFIRDLSADKLSARAIPCVFLGFVLDAHGWQFYHPTSRCVFPSQDVTFDEVVPFYRLFPYRSTPPPPPPLFLAPGPPSVDPLPPQAQVLLQVQRLGVLHLGVWSQGGAGSEGAGSGGGEPGGEEPWGAEPAGVETGGVEPGGAESEGAEFGGAEPRGVASSGGPAGASPRLSPQQLREWFVRRARLWSGATGAGGAGDTGAGCAGVTAGAGGTSGTAATGPGGARTRGTGAAGSGGVEGAGSGDPTEPGAAGAGGIGAGGAGAGGAGAAGAGAVDPGAGGTGDTVRPRLYSFPYFSRFLSQPPLLPASPLCAPSPFTEQSGGLTKRRKPASRPVSPVCTARRVPHSRPPPVPGTHARPSSVPLQVPLPAPPESSLHEVPDPESDRACAASPTVSRLLAIVVTDPSFESAAASALVAELLDFAVAYRLDYTTALVAESASASPPSIGGECALGTDVLKDRQEDFECLAAAVPRFASMLLAPEGDSDALDIPTPRSYPEAITAQRDYELHSLDFSTAFLHGCLHEEIWQRRPPGFTELFPAGTQWSLRRPVYGLRQAPREWHDTLRTTLAALGCAPSTADPSLFLPTDTSLPPFYVLVYVDDLIFATADTEALTLVKSELHKRYTCTDLGELRSYLGLQITRDRARHTITLTQSHMVHQVLQRFGFQFSSPQPTPLSSSHSLSAPPSDDTSGMGLVLGGRGPVVLTGHADASWVDDSATQWSSQGYTFSLGSGSVSWRFTRSSSVLSSSCEAEIYVGAMAAQELRWLTYLLTDLGEQPRLPPVLYVDNKAMIALCQEHRTKHIALRYFLARELQQRVQLRLAYVATRANTAYIFTKALPPGYHQRFSTVLGLVPILPHLLTA
ncbi:unnamed protein product [Closterium sp. NIES-54]